MDCDHYKYNGNNHIQRNKSHTYRIVHRSRRADCARFSSCNRSVVYNVGVPVRILLLFIVYEPRGHLRTMTRLLLLLYVITVRFNGLWYRRAQELGIVQYYNARLVCIPPYCNTHNQQYRCILCISSFGEHIETK